MELHQLFKVQDIIENQIKELSGLKEDFLGEENVSELRFLALQVKIGELANLTKCYKYAKVKDDISKDKVMILYIDTMKYLLSIGNMYEFNIIDVDAFSSVKQERSIVKLFSIIFEDVVSLKKAALYNDYLNALLIYIRLFARFVNLGSLLNLSFNEVYDFYIDKYMPKESKVIV